MNRHPSGLGVDLGAIEIAGVVQLDDGVALVRRDGTLELLIASGHARPLGWHSAPTTTRRRP